MASSRRAHQVFGMELPSVGEWAATSPHTITCVIPKNLEGGRATSSICGLPPLQEGRISLITCAHIFQDMKSIKCLSIRSCPPLTPS
jgi:hypothetical protein